MSTSQLYQEMISSQVPTSRRGWISQADCDSANHLYPFLATLNFAKGHKGGRLCAVKGMWLRFLSFQSSGVSGNSSERMVEGSCVIRRVEVRKWKFNPHIDKNQLSQFAIFDLCMHSLSLNLSPQKCPTVQTCTFIIHNDTYSIATVLSHSDPYFLLGTSPSCVHMRLQMHSLETLNISKQCPMHHHSCFLPSINDRRVLALETKLMEASIVSILPPLIRTPCGKTINSVCCADDRITFSGPICLIHF